MSHSIKWSSNKKKRQPRARIVGITLVKNEDLHIERVIENVINFCDLLIVLDNYSWDRTWPIIKRLAGKYKHLKAKRIANSLKSHGYLERFAGTRTWVFGVDGDEVYDPSGLGKLRAKILSGKYDKYWRIWGYTLHCIALNSKKGLARGYLSPAAKSVTKLYNFSFLKSWREDHAERLHGTNIRFKKQYPEKKRANYRFFSEYSWDKSWLRCLHFGFLKRSSLDKSNTSKGRLGPTQASSFLFRSVNFLRNILFHRKIGGSYYKLSKYQQGPIIVKKIKGFL